MTNVNHQWESFHENAPRYCPACGLYEVSGAPLICAPSRFDEEKPPAGHHAPAPEESEGV